MSIFVLVDADGVVADLHPELARIHSFKMEDWVPGCYDIEKSFPHITTTALWEHPAVKHPDFWADIPKTPWADELMDFLLTRVTREDICFLTMPVLDPNCAAGKMRWFKKHYPKHKFLIGTSKKFCAGPGKYLIDDSEKNVDEFNAHGGKGILFPRIWNRDHVFFDNVDFSPIDRVKELLK